jgi:hypothetical protein
MTNCNALKFTNPSNSFEFKINHDFKSNSNRTDYKFKNRSIQPGLNLLSPSGILSHGPCPYILTHGCGPPSFFLFSPEPAQPSPAQPTSSFISLFLSSNDSDSACSSHRHHALHQRPLSISALIVNVLSVSTLVHELSIESRATPCRARHVEMPLSSPTSATVSRRRTPPVRPRSRIASCTTARHPTPGPTPLSDHCRRIVFR